VTKMSTIYRRS